MTYSMNRRQSLVAGAALLGSASITSTLRALENKPSTERLVTRLNPVIQRCRDAAMKLLDVSARDLQHGLELHADSIVFDSYGFSPRAAIDGDAMKAAVESGASAIELKDLNEDMTMTRYVSDPVEQQEYRDAWRSSGVTCIFQNAGEEGQDPLRLLKRLARFTYATDILKGFVSKVAVPADVEQAKSEDRHCLCFTGNGVPLTQQWVSVEDELRYVKVFYQLGIRMMHLTYQRRNMIGDGCAEKANAGLSDFLITAIKEMNRIGVIPDCAHSGWQTSLEAAQVSDKPVVASHTTIASIHPHIRSKPDEVIKAIADSGGYLGMCCVPRFLRGSGDIVQLLNHVDYIVKNYGADYVAIGTDVAYNSQNAVLNGVKCHLVADKERNSDHFGRMIRSVRTQICVTAWRGQIGRYLPLGWFNAATQMMISAKSSVEM